MLPDSTVTPSSDFFVVANFKRESKSFFKNAGFQSDVTLEGLEIICQAWGVFNVLRSHMTSMATQDPSSKLMSPKGQEI